MERISEMIRNKLRAFRQRTYHAPTQIRPWDHKDYIRYKGYYHPILYENWLYFKISDKNLQKLLQERLDLVQSRQFQAVNETLSEAEKEHVWFPLNCVAFEMHRRKFNIVLEDIKNRYECLMEYALSMDKVDHWLAKGQDPQGDTTYYYMERRVEQPQRPAEAPEPEETEPEDPTLTKLERTIKRINEKRKKLTSPFAQLLPNMEQFRIVDGKRKRTVFRQIYPNPDFDPTPENLEMTFGRDLATRANPQFLTFIARFRAIEVPVELTDSSDGSSPDTRAKRNEEFLHGRLTKNKKRKDRKKSARVGNEPKDGEQSESTDKKSKSVGKKSKDVKKLEPIKNEEPKDGEKSEAIDKESTEIKTDPVDQEPKDGEKSELIDEAPKEIEKPDPVDKGPKDGEKSKIIDDEHNVGVKSEPADQNQSANQKSVVKTLKYSKKWMPIPKEKLEQSKKPKEAVKPKPTSAPPSCAPQEDYLAIFKKTEPIEDIPVIGQKIEKIRLKEAMEKSQNALKARQLAYDRVAVANDEQYIDVEPDLSTIWEESLKSTSEYSTRSQPKKGNIDLPTNATGDSQSVVKPTQQDDIDIDTEQNPTQKKLKSISPFTIGGGIKHASENKDDKPDIKYLKNFNDEEINQMKKYEKATDRELKEMLMVYLKYDSDLSPTASDESEFEIVDKVMQVPQISKETLDKLAKLGIDCSVNRGNYLQPGLYAVPKTQQSTHIKQGSPTKVPKPPLDPTEEKLRKMFPNIPPELLEAGPSRRAETEGSQSEAVSSCYLTAPLAPTIYAASDDESTLSGEWLEAIGSTIYYTDDED